MQHILKACEFEAIYNVGDSISNAGNLIQEDPDSVFSMLPYGQNLFNNPTGRCFSGLLIIDLNKHSFTFRNLLFHVCVLAKLYFYFNQVGPIKK
ncbi:hypothetical protein P3X46_022690 [Hevea brasiliensis]|uniref:Uncharacterized protein n=1 Tax=Hevea brasiliensis TaxID=3981 RepID=A0ABQ9LAA2_HEVBR|nr:hypothetical protein P3X46_022690 [Hevea brasiliensis]